MYRATHFEKLIVDTHITRTSLGKCIYAVKSRVGLLQAYCYAGREFTGMQGAATRQIQCHDFRATCHIAGYCHLVNSMSCHPRATCHIAGCCHLANSMSCHLRATCHIARWLRDDMPLNSPGGSTLQCGTWQLQAIVRIACSRYVMITLESAGRHTIV